MNWGKGILAAIIVFMAGVAVMVSISISKDVDLVAANYYEKEIKYQDEINRINNTDKLEKQVNFEVNNGVLMFEFPVMQTAITGEADFYRPSDSRKDFKVRLDVDQYGRQVIDISTIDKGLWKVKILWEAENKQLLSTNSIIVK